MKNIFISAFLVSSAFFSSLCFAINSDAETLASRPLKIALVDVQSAILQTNEGKAAREKIEKEVSQKRQNLLDQENKLKKLQEEMQAQQSILSEADKLTKQKDFQSKLQAFQQSQLSFQRETQQKESFALQQIFQNIQIEVQKIAKERGFDMVFDKSAAVLLFANNTSDVTLDVVAKYNADYKIKDKK